MTAKEFLRSLRKMTLEIEALREEIILLRQEAEGIKAMTLSDMPKGGQPKDAAEIIAEVADLQRTRYERTLERMEKREQAWSSPGWRMVSSARCWLCAMYLANHGTILWMKCTIRLPLSFDCTVPHCNLSNSTCKMRVKESKVCAIMYV